MPVAQRTREGIVRRVLEVVAAVIEQAACLGTGTDHLRAAARISHRARAAGEDFPGRLVFGIEPGVRAAECEALCDQPVNLDLGAPDFRGRVDGLGFEQ